MNQHEDRDITYLGFTQYTDQVISVSRRDNAQDKVTFNFQDDNWHLLDLLRPHERNGRGTIVFSELPAWLQQSVKHYIAHLWLRCSIDISIIQTIMVKLRCLGKLLPSFTSEPIELRAQHARDFSRKYLELNLSPGSNMQTQRYINNFISFVRQQHPKLNGNGFEVLFPQHKTKKAQPLPLEQPLEALIATDRLALIVDACMSDVQAYLEAKRNYIDPIEHYHEYNNRRWREYYRRLKEGKVIKRNTLRLVDLLGRAIKGQAVILGICVGRRTAAICNT